MGVNGLWSLIEPLEQQLPVTSLQGKIVAIDFSSWIHKAYRAYNAREKNQKANPYNSPLYYIFKRICFLLSLNIKPVFVFDGAPIDAKRQVIRDRKRNAIKNQQEAEDMARKYVLNQMIVLNSNQADTLNESKNISQIDDCKLRKDEDIFELDSKKSTISYSPKLEEIEENPTILELKSQMQSLIDESTRFSSKNFKLNSFSTSSVDHLNFSEQQINSFNAKRRLLSEIKDCSQSIANQRAKDSGFDIGATNANNISVLAGRPLQDEDNIYVYVKEVVKTEEYSKNPTESEICLEDKYEYQLESSNINTHMVPMNLSKKRNRKISRKKQILMPMKAVSWSNESLIKKLSESESEFSENDEKGNMVRDTFEETCGIQQMDTIEYIDVNDDTCSTQNKLPPDPNHEVFSKNIKEAVSSSQTQIFNNVEPPQTNSKDAKTKIKNQSNDSPPKILQLDLSEVFRRKEMYQEMFNKYSSRGYVISKQDLSELTDMLEFLGLPWIMASGEAEAQCAKMNEIGMCDFVASEDSDSLMFGAKYLIRGLLTESSKKSNSKFDNGMHVKVYSRRMLEKAFGLSKERLGAFAMLVGCDYTLGVTGVGPLLALEIISMFNSDSGWQILNDFYQFCQSDDKMNDPLSKRLSKLKIPENFLSERVWKSIIEPSVKKVEEHFEWKTVIEENRSLKNFCKHKFLWSDEKFDSFVAPLTQSSVKYRTEQKSFSWPIVESNLDESDEACEKIRRKLRKRLQSIVEKILGIL